MVWAAVVLGVAAQAGAAWACAPELEACLESDAPLAERQAALAAADLGDEAVRAQLLRVFVDGPLHRDLTAALVKAGLVPAALAGQVPTRSRVRARIGASPPVDACDLTVRADAIGVSCRAHAGCAGACLARYEVASFWGDGPVSRTEDRTDDGSCGCCTSYE